MNVPESVWAAWRRELHRFIAGRIGDPVAAEDIVHEVLLRAHARRGQLESAAKLRGWLYGITRNAIADHFRARRPMAELPEDLAAEEPDPRGTAARELSGCLRPLVAGLPPAYGTPLAMADLDGIPQARIARDLGLSLSGAKSRIQRARVMLAQALLACCHVERDRAGAVEDFAARKGRGSCCGTGAEVKAEKAGAAAPGSPPAAGCAPCSSPSRSR